MAQVLPGYGLNRYLTLGVTFIPAAWAVYFAPRLPLWLPRGWCLAVKQAFGFIVATAALLLIHRQTDVSEILLILPVVWMAATGGTSQAAIAIVLAMASLSALEWLDHGGAIWNDPSCLLVWSVIAIAGFLVGHVHDRNEKVIADAETTRRKLAETETQLIQAGKLNTLGQLTADIIHELGQPLTAIRWTAQLGQADSEPNSPHARAFGKIEEHTIRLTATLSNLRDFYRKSGGQFAPVDLNRSVLKSVALLENQLESHDVEIETSLSDDLPSVLGDEQQLEQVFVNLIANARDAMRTGRGKLSIKSESTAGGYAVVRLADTGTGIKSEHLHSIFDPFFTTKSGERGTGLGLSISRRIARNHGGWIEVDSKTGEGSTFRVVLPVGSGAHLASSASQSRAGPSAMNHTQQT